MKNLFLCSYFAGVADKFAGRFDVKGKNICFIATAAKFEEIDFYVDEAREVFIKMGANILPLDLAEECKSEAQISECDDTDKRDQILAAFNAADIIYVSGGNTFYLLSQMRKSGANELIKSFVNSGKLYIGESAGAIVTAPDTTYATIIDDASETSDFSGLNLIDFAVVPHFNEEPFVEAANEILAKFKDKIPLKAIKNDEAIAVDESGARVI